MKTNVREKLKNIAAALISFTAFLAFWHFGTDGTELGNFIPGPLPVISTFFRTFVEPIGGRSILGHMGVSFTRVFTGYAIAAVSGISLGVFMGWNRYAAAVFRPFYEMMRPIPPIAWIPLAILWFGVGETPMIFLIFIASFNNITINAYEGALSVDKTLMGASKMLGANNIQTLFTVILPASVPAIFAGLQVAVSVAWATVVAAEMVRSSAGVGWLIINGQLINNTTQILVGIIAIGIVGFLLAVAMRGLEEKLCAWNKSST